MLYFLIVPVNIIPGHVFDLMSNHVHPDTHSSAALKYSHGIDKSLIKYCSNVKINNR